MQKIKLVLHRGFYTTIICALLLLPAMSFIDNVKAAGDTYYIETSGNDGNDCSDPFTNACATLDRALEFAGPGDYIELGTGTYNSHTDKNDFWIAGTSGNILGDTLDEPITIQSDGGTVVISGENVSNFSGQSDSVVSFRYAQNFVIKDITIDGGNGGEGVSPGSNPRSRGLSFETTSADIVAQDLIVRGTYYKGVGISGQDIILENSEVYNTSRDNYEGAQGGSGWQQAVSTYSGASSVIIRNNYIHENWGEGIDLILAENVTVEGNVLHDNYSANIYVDTSKNAEIRKNYIYRTTAYFDRYDNGNRANSILLANENSTSSYYINNIEISNNILGLGNRRGVAYFDSNGGYDNVTIYYNTIYGQTEEAIWFENDGEGTVGNELRNNIIEDSGADSVIDIASADRSSWTFESNAWVNETPAAYAQDADDVYTSDVLYDGSPINGTPNGTITVPASISKPFYPVPEAQQLYLTSGSPVLSSGTPLTENTDDYSGVTRDPVETTLGALEYTGDTTNPDPDPPIDPPTTPRTDTVYRFYNLGSSSHFYTINAAERNGIQASLPQFIYEGSVYQVLKFGYGGVPVYRFYNPSSASHFYTNSDAEKNAIIKNLPQYIFEGISYYVYTTPASDRQPVYRFFNVDTKAHLFTNSAVEKNSVQANLPQYVYEGIAYYIPK